MRTQLTRSITLFESTTLSTHGIDAQPPTTDCPDRSGAERVFSSLLLGLSVAYALLSVIPLLPPRYWL